MPDLTPRPLDELLTWAERTNEHRDQGQTSRAGRDLGTLLTELQVYALTAGSAGSVDRARALSALVQMCHVAGGVARVLINELGQPVRLRGEDTLLAEMLGLMPFAVGAVCGAGQAA